MKKHYGGMIVFLLIIVLCLLLFKVDFKTVDSLMRPPKSEGENLEIRTAFEAVAGDKYNFKSPISGEYNSSFIQVDLNSDGDNEVLVFYCYASSLDTVRINVIDKVDGKWKSIADIESSYSDIHRVDFADTDSDGCKEIILGYSIYETELTNTLNVYKINFNGNGNNIVNIFECSYTNFIVCDVNSDKKTDLLVFDKSAGSKLTGIKVTYYDFSNNRAYNAGEYYVDAVISSISSVKTDSAAVSGETCFYVDGFRTDNGMTTDVFKWDSRLKMFVKSITPEEIPVTSVAIRNINIACTDINSDGLIEIPVEEIIPGSSVVSRETSSIKPQSVIKWTQLKNGVLSAVGYEIINAAENYSLVLDGNFFGKFTVNNDTDTGLLTFYAVTNPPQEKKAKKKKEEASPAELRENEPMYSEEDILFTVFATSDSDNNLYELSGYRFIRSDNGNNYYCQIYNKGRQLGITKETIKNILIT